MLDARESDIIFQNKHTSKFQEKEKEILYFLMEYVA